MTNNEFLEGIMLKSPLYKKQVHDRGVFVEDLVSLNPINFCCNNCGSEQTFELYEIDNDTASKAGHSWQQYSQLSAASLMSGRGLQPTSVGNSTRHITFRCAKCKNYTIHFYIAFWTITKPAQGKKEELTETEVQKIGQLPAFESTIDATIEKWFSKSELDLYRKGVRSEAHGFGIGAFSYFRRIVENNAQKILEGMRNATDSDELKTAISEALKKKNATDRLELVKDHAPTSFAVEGQNVFTILYGALSAGMHGKSDEECLALATSVRVCLGFLVKKIATAQQEQTKLKEALKNIT